MAAVVAGVGLAIGKQVPPQWKPKPKIDGCYFNRALPVDWVDGRLVVTVEPHAGDPQESSERLYWTKGRLFRRIERLSDLKGHVRLRTAGDALQFVRLLTSPVTLHLFARWHPEIVEVGSPEDFDLRAYFGNINRRDSMMELEEVVSPNRREVWPYVGYFGILSRPLMAKIHLKPTWVEPMPGGFQIHRVLLIDSANKQPAQAIIVTERVTYEGSYHRAARRIPMPNVFGPNWRVPKPE